MNKVTRTENEYQSSNQMITDKILKEVLGAFGDHQRLVREAENLFFQRLAEASGEESIPALSNGNPSFPEFSHNDNAGLPQEIIQSLNKFHGELQSIYVDIIVYDSSLNKAISYEKEKINDYYKYMFNWDTLFSSISEAQSQREKTIAEYIGPDKKV